MKIVLPLIGSAFFVAALVTAFWMIGSASGERDKFSSLEIAPAEADVFFAINTDPTSPQWLAVNRSLDSIGVKDPLREAIDEALAEVNLDWDEDIVPIAGDEAFVSVPDVSAASQSGGFVAGFRLRDEDGARDVFEKLRALAEDEGGEAFLEEEYEGVTIFYTEPTSFGDGGFFGEESDSSSGDGFSIGEGDESDDLFFECLFEEGGESRPDCAPLFACPWYTDDTADDSDYEDADENFIPDACETGPFFEDAGFSGFDDDDGAEPIIEDSISGASFGVSPGGAVAIFDDVLVLAAAPDDVKSVVDVVQGRAPSAETNERLQEFREAQKDDFLMWGYVDLASVWDMAGGIWEESGDDYGYDLRELEDQLRGQFDRAGFSISSFDEGFALDFTVLQAPDYEAAYEWEPSEPFDPRFAEWVPEDTMFFMAMNTFYQQSYAQFREQIDGLSAEQREAYDDVIEMIADEVGINIEEDVLALLTGETAIAGNLSGFDSSAPDFEVVGLADVDDDTKATETLEKLGAYLEGQGVIETGESGSVNLWKPFGASNSDAIGWSVKDGVAAVGYPWEVTEESGATRDSSLADTSDWQRTLDLLPDNGVFVGYLSIARILEEVKSTPDAEASFADSTGGEVTLDDLDAIRALGFSGTIRENGFGYHIVLFMEDR